MKTEIVNWGKKIIGEIAKNSPTILTGMGVAGTCLTAIFASKATLQAERELEKYYEIHETDTEPPTMMDKAKVVLPLYIPTAITGLTTAACIIGSHEINVRRQAALASAYSLSTEAMKELQNKVTETYGEKDAKKLKSDIREDHIKANPIKEEKVVLTGHGNALFFDEQSGRYFRCDMEVIKRAINNLNEDLLNGNYVLLNDFYYAIGLGQVKLGDQLGWNLYSTGKIEVDFDYRGEEYTGEPCGVLVYNVAPTFDYGN